MTRLRVFTVILSGGEAGVEESLLYSKLRIVLSETKRPIGPSGHFPTAVGKHLPAMRQPMAPCRSGELSAKLTEGHPFPGPFPKVDDIAPEGKAFGEGALLPVL